MTRRVPPVMTSSIHFNPHSPCGERLMPTLAGVSGHSFQSTLPLRGATNVRTVHAVSNRYFNPHSPCGERHMPPFHIGVAELFQSTLPLRGATSPTRWNPRQSNFNPHSPCGERLHRPYRGRRQPISIHTPLAGSDSGHPGY